MGEAFFTNKYFDLFILQLSTLSVSGYSNFHYFIVVWSSTLLSQQLQRNTQLLPRCSLHLHSLICCSDSFFLSKAVKMMPVGRGIIKKLRKFNNLFKSEKKLKTEQQNRVRRQSICVGDFGNSSKACPIARRSSNLLTTRNSKTGSLKTPFWLTICTTSTVTNTVCKPTTLADFGRSPLQIYEGTQWSVWNPLPLWLPSKAERKTL